MIGKADISSPYKLALEKETVEVTIENKKVNLPVKKIKLSFALLPTNIQIFPL